MIDKNSSKPIYIQISDYLKDQIEQGKLKPGDLIPSENSISQEYNVSRMTIRHAIDILVNEGYLQRKRGKGTYVSNINLEHNAYKLSGFTEEILRFNKKPTNKVTRFEIKSVSSKLCKKLNINENELVYLVERVRCVDDEPVVFERSYMPVEMFPNLSISNFRGSKYKYVEETTSLRIKESLQEIVPEIIQEPIQSLLNMNKGEPILKVKSTTTLENGTTFEYTETYFKTERYKFIQKAIRF